MKLKTLTLREGFRVVRGNRRSQAAEMVIAPVALRYRRNRQRACQEEALQARRRGLLRTINFYVPPAYAQSAEPLPRGRK